jgi:hypothetical protein
MKTEWLKTNLKLGTFGNCKRTVVCEVCCRVVWQIRINSDEPAASLFGEMEVVDSSKTFVCIRLLVITSQKAVGTGRLKNAISF